MSMRVVDRAIALQPASDTFEGNAIDLSFRFEMPLARMPNWSNLILGRTPGQMKVN